MIPKLRAWDKNLKLIRKVSDIDFQNEEVGFYVDDYEGEGYIPEFEIARNFDEVELMQSTGLKDKNGVQIFEGDVLQYKYPYDRRVRTVSKVVWREDKACFALRDIKRLTTEDIELYRVTTENYLEIIGNIYENKELLEVENE